MSSPVRISVVLASYNGESYISEQLNSLLAFLDECDEIVISDDGSNDSTRDRVEAIGDARIRLLPVGPRLGYQRNFERAIASARGEYIFFSDQDDICLPARIEQSLDALKNCALVCGDAVLVDSNLKVTSNSFFLHKGAKSFTPLRLFVKPSIIGATMACSRIFLESALPFPLNVPHDQWLSVVAAMKGDLRVVSEPFILYRRHSSVVSTTGTRSGRSLLTVLIERWRLARALFAKLVFGAIGRVVKPNQ
jgi:glycosyltransferase involved in cell wall biosynthesis